jgi:hypothetical protein
MWLALCYFELATVAEKYADPSFNARHDVKETTCQLLTLPNNVEDVMDRRKMTDVAAMMI